MQYDLSSVWLLLLRLKNTFVHACLDIMTPTVLCGWLYEVEDRITISTMRRRVRRRAWTQYNGCDVTAKKFSPMDMLFHFWKRTFSMELIKLVVFGRLYLQTRDCSEVAIGIAESSYMDTHRHQIPCRAVSLPWVYGCFHIIHCRMPMIGSGALTQSLMVKKSHEGCTDVWRNMSIVSPTIQNDHWFLRNIYVSSSTNVLIFLQFFSPEPTFHVFAITLIGR